MAGLESDWRLYPILFVEAVLLHPKKYSYQRFFWQEFAYNQCQLPPVEHTMAGVISLEGRL